MARDFISLGDVAARDVAMIDIRCGRCDRHGRLSVARLMAEWGADASIRAPTRVRDAASYLLDSSVSTEDEKRLATEAIEWLRSKRDEKPPPISAEVSEPKPARGGCVSFSLRSFATMSSAMCFVRRQAQRPVHLVLGHTLPKHPSARIQP